MGKTELVVFESEFRTVKTCLNDVYDNLIRHQSQRIKDIVELMVKSDAVFTTGVGKSAYVAQYFSDLLSSLSLPAYFVDPINIMHGDIGRVTKNGPLIVYTKSGNTEELLPMLKYVQHRMEIVFITCSDTFDLRPYADHVLNVGPIHEGNFWGFPGGSFVSMSLTSASLAAEVANQLGLTRENYAILHPGGQIGKDLSHLREDVDDSVTA